MTDPLSDTLFALADPTRRAILARLSQGEATVNELAAPFDISLPGVSKHLKVLERAKLISRGRNAQWRPCRLETAPLRDVDDWLTDYRKLWESRLDRLEIYLAELQAKQDGKDGSKP
ncbi:MAG: metalloregulator ArsR/SmtB family transcription factor [Hoeflea sp.]|nr:metalloregulator ArsR/SmtB family transcription factor [Hoeflea sp.]